MTLGLVVTLRNFHSFPSLRVFFWPQQFNRSRLWCPPKCVPFAPFNYSSLSYTVLALPSAVTKLLNKTLILHNFKGPTIKFHVFQGLANEILKFHDFPGFPWPVRTLLLLAEICFHMGSKTLLHLIPWLFYFYDFPWRSSGFVQIFDLKFKTFSRLFPKI